MTLNEIVKDLEHTIEYFKEPKTQLQVGRRYQAEKTLEQLRLYGVVGQSEQLVCSCDNPNGFKEMEEGRENCSKCKKPY